jgi:rare lipoprotein A
LALTHLITIRYISHMKSGKVILVLVLFVSFGFRWLQTFTQTGTASYYADKFHGRKTYSGEKYDKRLLTGAHASLAMGTLVKVTNLKNDSTVVLKINDRLPTKSRILDVSRAGAEQLNFIRDGLAKVKLEVVE